MSGPVETIQASFPYLSLFGGGLLSLLGVLSIGAYVVEAVIRPWGQPDQSLLFWYLIFVFIGGVLLAAGTGLILLGWEGLKKKHDG